MSDSGDTTTDSTTTDITRASGTDEAPGFEERLRADREASSRLISGMAHDARTPLGSVLMMADMLADDPGGNLDAKQVGYARKIRQAVTEVRDLLETVNLIAKLTARRIEPSPAPADLRTLVEQAVERSAAEPAVTLDPELPAGVTIDAERFDAALVALLNAAYHASPDDVRLAVSSAGGELVCTLGDRGGAIGESERTTLFEPFSGTGRRWRSQGGKSLDLALAHTLATWAGGRLELTRSNEEGTTFELAWPIG